MSMPGKYPVITLCGSTRFKAVIDRCPYRQEWFAHKQRCLEAYVREEIDYPVLAAAASNTKTATERT